MRFIKEHIDRVKKKPHHVRKQIAFTYAGVSASGIALVWLLASFATGAFFIPPTESAGDASVAATPTASGAAAATLAGQEDPTSEASIRIVDAPASTTSRRPDATTIPF